MNQDTLYLLVIVLSPVLAGAMVVLLKPAFAVDWMNRFGAWAGNKKTQYSSQKGIGSRFMLRPVFWGFTKIDEGTGAIEDQFQRSGVRVAAYAYYIAPLLYVALMLTMVVAAIAFMLFVLWLVIRILEGEGSSAGYSVRRSTLFGGERTEHYDGSGRHVGHSEEKESILGGEYTQHYDKSGTKAGYSEEKEGLLGGRYVQEHDEAGTKVGYSEKKEGVLGGEYVQHYVQQGDKVGYSEKKQGILGERYVQHYDQGGKKSGESGEES